MCKCCDYVKLHGLMLLLQKARVKRSQKKKKKEYLKENIVY